MLRQFVVPAVALIAVSCAGQDAITSPTTAGSARSMANLASCSVENGQLLLDAGQYKAAIREFSCLIAGDPTGIEGYRGRIEAQLLLGQFSDALRDYTRVTSFVLPVHPDAQRVIVAGYEARLKANPDASAALTGQSFAYWYFFDYAAAIHVLEHLVDVQPNDVYGNLFRGSSRFLRGRTAGAADLERAIALAPLSPDVRYIVADAYTYGAAPAPQRAFAEATLALEGGLDTPRVHAILAASYIAFGDVAAAAAQIKIHFDQVTTELVVAPALADGSSASLPAVPGRTFEIPLVAAAGETVSVSTSSKDYFDTILVLLAPDGTPLVGSDDANGYFAALDWVAPSAGTYRLRVALFEAVNIGTLLVSRK